MLPSQQQKKTSGLSFFSKHSLLRKTWRWELENKELNDPLLSARLQRTGKQFILFKCQWVHAQTHQLHADVLTHFSLQMLYEAHTHTPLLPLGRHERKTFIKWLLHTAIHMQRDTRVHLQSHTLSASHSHSHQIKAKGSGSSRPRLALDSPGRRGGAVWAEVPKLCGLHHLLYRSRIKHKQNRLKPAARVRLEPGRN